MIARLVATAAFLLVASGCAGAGARVVARDAIVPVSMSHGVRDADGRIVPQAHLVKVGRFRTTATAWSILYTAIPLSRRKDISRAVNTQALARGGQAIVNVEVHSDSCVANWLAPLTWIPLWPGCNAVSIDGDIVKLQRPNSGAVAPASLAASQDSFTWLHEQCAFLGPASGGIPDESPPGMVDTPEGRFACVERPPGMSKRWTPADERLVLCLDVAAGATCIPPIDPARADRHEAGERAIRAEALRAEQARTAANSVAPTKRSAPRHRKTASRN